ncbi:hypothetical protein LTR85_002317 [Meristemomyces frigidus]|nr:hypothetical protein LTR85_002317 [Meristemomyces frigidus]
MAVSTRDNILSIREATTDDAVAIASIYNHYVRESIATLQENDATVGEISSKLDSIRSKGMPYVVTDDSAGTLYGYAYADDWNGGTGYKSTVECSIYLQPDHCGRGIGKSLLPHVFAKLRACGKEQVVAKISILPGQAAQEVPSCRLHIAYGFVPVGRLLKVGFKKSHWIDVIFLQLALNGVPK